MTDTKRETEMTWTIDLHATLTAELEALTDGTMDAGECVTEAAYERAERLIRAIRYLAKREG
jgi:hypothetical protein